VSLCCLFVASPRATLKCIPAEQLILPAASTDEAYPQDHQQVPLTVPSTKANHGHALPAAAASTQLTYRDVAATGILPRGSSSLTDSEFFQTITYKRETTARNPPAARTNKRRRQPLLVLATLHPCLWFPKLADVWHFLYLFSSEVTADDIHKSIMEQLSLNKLVCTRFNTKFSSYASFHVSVLDDDFPLINDLVLWLLNWALLWQAHA
jgi:hypothetical protein